MKYVRSSLACLLAVVLLFTLGTVVWSSSSMNEHSAFSADDYPATIAGKGFRLILAQGEDGTLGYVRNTDLGEPVPESPEAALAQQAARRASGCDGEYINLYDADGVTVIGRFFVSWNS